MNELIKAADQVVNWWKESGMHIVGGAPACMFKLREELEKIVPPHRSDCAVHNAPAMPIGQCDCGSIEVVEAAKQGGKSNASTN